MSQQLSLIPDGRTLRDRGIARVTENADERWKATVDSWILWFANDGRPFSVEDIREVVPEEPHHPNAWGSRFSAAAKRGLIRRVGFKTPSRPSRHANALAVWRGA